jgi:hypothetical protein
MMPIFINPARLSLVAASILASCFTHAFCQSAPVDYVPNLPYTAQVVQTDVQTGANGRRVQRETRLVEARDSQGSTRIESFDLRNASHPGIVNLYDPLRRQFIQLFPEEKMARVMTFPGTGPIPTHEAPLNPALSAVKTSVEHLGGQTIYGIYVEGTRTTQVIPASGGHGQDVAYVEETWVSPDLKIVVLSRATSTDLRSAETTWKIVQLDQNEPDPALFEIPADYTIVNVTAGPQ